MSTPREMHEGLPQDSVLSPTWYSMYINDILQTPGVYVAVFADATRRKEGYVLRKLRRGVSVGTLKSMKIKLGSYTSRIYLDHLRFISH
jgi:hypothetical protein